MKLPISEVNNGMKLSKDVYSKLGGILYKKDTILHIIDREILEAFGVKEVDIELDEDGILEKDEAKEEIVEKNSKDDDNFNNLFNQAIKKIDNIQKIAQGNGQIPIMEIRKVLQPLLNDRYLQIKYLLSLKYKSNDFIKYDSHHAISVSMIGYAIGKWLGLEQAECMQLALAGSLHDIGKARIPDYITNSSGKISKENYEEMKKHTLYGYQILKETKGLNEGALLAVLQHHERIDGSGYPLQLKKEGIHQYSKIISIADVFHALLSKRNFRTGYSLFQALDQMIEESFGKLDPSLVNILTNKITNYIIGSKVILSNGKKGTVIFVDQKYPTKPWVQVDDSIVNLITETKISIQEIVS